MKTKQALEKFAEEIFTVVKEKDDILENEISQVGDDLEGIYEDITSIESDITDIQNDINSLIMDGGDVVNE